MNFSPMLFIACIYILEVNIIQNDEHKHAFTFAMINTTVKSIISGCCLLCYVHCQVFFKCSSFDYHTCLFISKVHVMSFGFFPSEFDPILLTLDYQCFDWLIFFFLQNVVLSDAGNYTCHAYNKYNFDEAWGILIVRGRFDTPTQPSTCLLIFEKPGIGLSCHLNIFLFLIVSE